MKQLRTTELGTFLEALEREHRVIAPLRDGAEVALGDLDLERLAVGYSGRTRFSPKEFLFPESEVMFSFDLSKPAETIPIQEHLAETKVVLWGIRPCDLAGVRVLDAVFLSPPGDVYYEARRRNTILIALNCGEAGKSCFCASMGTGPFAKGGFDLLFTDLGEEYLVETGSETGARLLEEHGDLFADVSEQVLTAARELEQQVGQAFTTALDVSAVAARLPDAFDEPIWEELSRTCTLCGTCCIVCPACHCFNVEDLKKSRKLAQRVRYWDSCQFSGFTRMATSNSRPTQGERWRQKIYDKFCYVPAAHDGLLGCIGCGRCLELCQGSINIVDVLTKVTGGRE